MSTFDVKRAREILEHHFATVTNEELIENLRKWAPEMLEGDESVNDNRHSNPDVSDHHTLNLDGPKERPMNGSAINGAKKSFKIVVLPGDGIGPEVVAEGVKVLRSVE